MASIFQDVASMGIGSKVQHKYFKWQGVIENVLETNIVFVRWGSGIGLVYSTDMLVEIVGV